MKKTGKKWVAFNFNEDAKRSNTSGQINSTQLIKPELDVSAPRKRSINFQQRLAPKSIEDLAVHPKKINEVQSWLQFALQAKSQTANFLLITGPTGCGKTATVNVLCKNMSIDMAEWTNPMDQDYETFKGPNQVARFVEFLTEAKWTSLFSSNAKKIILVEEFPNVFLRNPEQFIDVLEDCYYKANQSVVFICTDSNNNKKSSSQLLFPEEVLAKFQIAHISFNACATTLMKTALKAATSLVQDNLDLFKTPTPDTVSAIITTSAGDIRCAINQYYFASLLGTPDLPESNHPIKKVAGKRKRNEKSSTVDIMSRDETLDLFHGLGRVLNPKRDASGRFTHDLDRLIDGFSTQPTVFTAFLFENYIKYFGDLYDASAAAEVLSLSQTFLDKWVDRHDVLIFALWVSVLGLMVHNEHRVSKWNPIKGPKKVEKRINNDLGTRNLSVTDLFYYNKIKGCDSQRFTNL